MRERVCKELEAQTTYGGAHQVQQQCFWGSQAGSQAKLSA